ncbi:MAG: ABC transporter permease [Bryobacteraceae bacterium]|nr:ABC transporter permease [Bryobacteraceae bacterium]
MTTKIASEKVLLLQPTRGWVGLRLAELWEFRELLLFLSWRDVKIRYKQTALGAAWAILQPLLTMLVFSLFFGKLAKIPSDGIPYPLFTLAGLVPWAFFSYGLTQSSNSVVAGAHMIRKIYFPRLMIPMSSVVAGGVDFFFALLLLFGMMTLNGIGLTARAWTLPAFVLLAFATSMGVGLWLAALNVQYRDIRYIVPFLVQFWMYATPIAYPSTLLPEPWRTVYGINPMAGVVEGFRWALLGAKTAPGPMILLSAGVALTLLVTGAFWFRRAERSFADVV